MTRIFSNFHIYVNSHYGVQNTMVRTVGVLLRLHVGLENRLRDHYRLHHAITNRATAQRGVAYDRLSVRQPSRPGLSLAGVRLKVTRLYQMGLPVLQVSPICRHAVANTPVRSLGLIAHETSYFTRFRCSPTTAAFLDI